MSKSRPRSTHDDQAVRLLDLALDEFARNGEVTSVHCDVCGSIIEIKTITDTTYSVNCSCGKFRSTMRGI